MKLPVPTGRVYFEGSPWPQGHRLPLFLLCIDFDGEQPMAVLEAASVPYRQEDGGKFVDDPTPAAWGPKAVWNSGGGFELGGRFPLDLPVPLHLGSLATTPLRVDHHLVERDTWEDGDFSFEGNIIHFEDFAAHEIQLRTNDGGATFDVDWKMRADLAQMEMKFEGRVRIVVESAPLFLRTPSGVSETNGRALIGAQVLGTELRHVGTQYGRRYFCSSA